MKSKKVEKGLKILTYLRTTLVNKKSQTTFIELQNSTFWGGLFPPPFFIS